MEFVLTNFRQDQNVRLFAFQAIAADRTRLVVTVGADLSLIRKYKIPLQELPLLCRRLLERSVMGPKMTAVMFTENEMLNYAKDRAAAEYEAAQKRKNYRVPTSARAAQTGRPGSGWQR